MCIHTNMHCTLNTCCTSSCYICSHALLKPSVFLPFLFVAMKCNMCQQFASFRARSEGDPFTWWCTECYDAHEHQDLPHDIEHPVLCIACKEQPASIRIRSQSQTSQVYWCYTCFERADHEEEVDDMLIADVDDPSDEQSSEDPDDVESLSLIHI